MDPPENSWNAQLQDPRPGRSGSRQLNAKDRAVAQRQREGFLGAVIWATIGLQMPQRWENMSTIITHADRYMCMCVYVYIYI